MIKPYLYVDNSSGKGRGMFTSQKIRARTVLEVAPVLVLSAKERKLVDETQLHDYIFEWGNSKTQCCVAFGYVSIYNHSYQSNCEYEMDYEQQTITIRAVRTIQEGEELFINYNGDFDNEHPLWFQAH